MAKGKKAGAAQGTKITLKMAKNALRVTPEGKLRLDLSNAGITTFPKCLLKLSNIEELDLSRNKLKTIPDFIRQFTGLRWLDLHSNQIEELPESIGRLGSLCHLNLCNNKIDSAGLSPEIGSLRNLQVLNLGMNHLTSLPPTLVALTNLTELGLFDNMLTEVPECIHMLPNLRKLKTKCNPVAYTQGNIKDLDTVKTMGNLYLVREGYLCQPCLERCKEECQSFKRKRLFDRSQIKSYFSGLMSPNSVAQGNQENWRLQTNISPQISHKEHGRPAGDINKGAFINPYK
ncbi:leucine-rich repeat-containing protein 18 [Xyrauchen texanus]|uniref:leucine-rich repeat-containing protein 18 n=1 Tax=Xyrauchen texanus TaxID=154827 RepID=UPI002242BB5E|nr:leucine-rich repeat-containing protein 18 [Xyrauchen texanus]XP_052007304.1 leucine-rich repeat-containing protein 18 [Xyrauchen texanus]